MSKPIEIDSMFTIVISQSPDYKHQLLRKVSEKVSEEPLKLYKVELADDSIVFVLAINEDLAIGQASCRDNTWIEQAALEKGATAILVGDFKIQGWGRNNFNTK